MNKKPQKRLFIGIPIGLNESENLDLLTTIQSIQTKFHNSYESNAFEYKWTPKKNLHLTLNFLGNIEINQLTSLKEVLQQKTSDHKRFTLKIMNVGAFPNSQQARTIWLGTQKENALLRLQGDLQMGLNQINIKSDERKFFPHITLARLTKAIHIGDFISTFPHTPISSLNVTQIVLYESHAQGHHSFYVPLETYSLERNDFNENNA